MATIISLAEKRIRTQEIREFLLSLPIAEHSPMIQYELLVAELSTLQKILNKLKAFIEFLSKLNPTQYLRWMHQAFARRSVIYSENEDLDHDLAETVNQVQSKEVPLDKIETKKKKLSPPK